MRTAYELGYHVYTVSDCVAATDVEAQKATLQFNFGMFSSVTKHADVVDALERGRKKQ
jgi:nicotinamidase-related amidase